MPNQNLLRQINLILYRLKRQWGLTVVYYQVKTQTHNVETGEITREYNTFTISRAPVLPNAVDRHFVYDLTYIAANNNFVEGALFDRENRNLIIDARDLPKGFEPSMDDHIEFEDQRYEMKKITALAQGRGYLLTVEGITSSETVD